MAKRARPRVDKAAIETGAVPASELDAVTQVRALLYAKLPEIMEKSIELALEGNSQINGKILDIIRDLMTDSSSEKGNDVLREIRKLREAALLAVQDDA